MTIGNRLKKLRENNNFTQKQIAEYLDYDQSYITKLEKDERRLTVYALEELCDLYNCPEEYILDGEENINNCMKKNEAMKVGNLPVNFGEKEAEKSMESLNQIINDILHEDQEDSNDSDKYNESFIKSIKNSEKQKSIEIKELNQLFKVSTDRIIKK